MHTEYSFDDLLAEHPYERPLVVDGVPCHGGFVGGRYVSPRTLCRAGAIEAWQARLPAGELAAVLDPISACVPPHFPSVEQTKLLVRHGVTVPLVRILSIIAIVEGFGGEERQGIEVGYALDRQAVVAEEEAVDHRPLEGPAADRGAEPELATSARRSGSQAKIAPNCRRTSSRPRILGARGCTSVTSGARSAESPSSDGADQ